MNGKGRIFNACNTLPMFYAPISECLRLLAPLLLVLANIQKQTYYYIWQHELLLADNQYDE